MGEIIGGAEVSEGVFVHEVVFVPRADPEDCNNVTEFTNNIFIKYKKVENF
ncbi:MAG TPA: hypothetical protein VGF75_02795 [Candidatus Saccharimonadales bacterium]